MVRQEKNYSNSNTPPLVKERYSLYDLKAKGISDFEGDKQEFSGHKTKAMEWQNDINRTADVVEIVDPKK